MDFLECKICHFPYDEGDHRPRVASCGHELCSVCLKELIKNSIFECPKCRKKHIVRVPHDLPISFGLIDVIRAFKTINISLTKETEPREPGATNYEVCKVHHKAIAHRCLKCHLWICDACLVSHTTLIGCSTVSSSTAVKSMKKKHTKNLNTLLTIFKVEANYVSSKIEEHNDKIQELTDKRKELLAKAVQHGTEVEKLRNFLKQGRIHKEKLVESKNHLNTTTSPYALMDMIEVFTHRKQELHSLSVTNLANDSLICLLKALEEDKDVYIEMVIKDEKKYAKVSQHEENICFHSFWAQKVGDDCICMPFDHLQKLIPENASLVFVELSLGGIVKGRIHLRLDKDLPNIRQNMVDIVTGQCGPTLRGISFGFCDHDDIQANGLPFSDIPVTPDSIGTPTVKRGDVIGNFINGYLEDIYFYVDTKPNTDAYEDNFCILGNIEDGLDVIQECHDNYKSDVIISDCGLVIEQE